MKVINDEEYEDLSELAKSNGIPYQVYMSKELFNLLKPNDFLSKLGIQFNDRSNAILSILRGNLLTESNKEIIPKDGITIPTLITKGAFIREELILIKSEIVNNNDNKNILLSVIIDTE